MKTERESRLEILAYKIWEEQGRPDGREADHWAEAERRLRLESESPDRSAAPTQDTPGRSKPSSSRQQTQPGQTTQTGSRELDGKPTSPARHPR